MESSDLRFNVLAFSPKEEGYTFYFTDREEEGLSRFYKTQVPEEVIEHFGKQDFFYTSFDKEAAGFLAVRKPCRGNGKVKTAVLKETGKEGQDRPVFSPAILKAYYQWLVAGYFRGNGFLVKRNFVHATDVWLPGLEENNEGDFRVFEKFNLQVRYVTVTEGWELLLSYEGKSRVLKRPVTALEDVNPAFFKWVIYDQCLYPFEEIPETARRNLDEVYPVLNYELQQVLGLTNGQGKPENKYKKSWARISAFKKEFLDTAEFNALIPMSPEGFIKVSEHRIGNVKPNSNVLLFGGEKDHIAPYFGIKENGPYELSPSRNICFFYILHEGDKKAAEIIHHYLKGEMAKFNGLSKFIKVPYLTDKTYSIVYQNREDPWPEIRAALLDKRFPPDIQFFAIYLSPFSKDESDPKRKGVYYRVKEALLKKGVLSQVIDAEKVISDARKEAHKKTYHLNLPNISIAILAKLNGTPWRLDTQLKKELVVGVGAYKSTLAGVQYIASAFSFSNTGKFNRFECFRQNQTRELAGSIIRAVKEYVSINQGISRLIIHFYKDMSRKEYQPIERGLNRLELDIPVYIVSINKTESRDITAFDLNWSHLMPHSGTFINLGRGEYLLFNNTRYLNNGFRESEGFPFPIKLRISCNEPELARDHKTVRELIDQVYQFSRMYWKSVSQQNLPVTIKYPEIVAEMFPHFEGNEIPDFGKDRLWFL